jgi:hypothetical protein
MEDSPLTAAAIERQIQRLSEGPPEEVLPELTQIAHRSIVELHKIARAQANSHRGQADWGRWARLANAVRSGVLQVAAIRDSVKGLGLQVGGGKSSADSTDLAPEQAIEDPADKPNVEGGTS